MILELSLLPGKNRPLVIAGLLRQENTFLVATLGHRSLRKSLLFWSLTTASRKSQKLPPKQSSPGDRLKATRYLFDRGKGIEPFIMPKW